MCLCWWSITIAKSLRLRIILIGRTWADTIRSKVVRYSVTEKRLILFDPQAFTKNSFWGPNYSTRGKWGRSLKTGVDVDHCHQWTTYTESVTSRCLSNGRSCCQNSDVPISGCILATDYIKCIVTIIELDILTRGDLLTSDFFSGCFDTHDLCVTRDNVWYIKTQRAFIYYTSLRVLMWYLLWHGLFQKDDVYLCCLISSFPSIFLVLYRWNILWLELEEISLFGLFHFFFWIRGD